MDAIIQCRDTATFSAIALDHLIEPGVSRTDDRSDPHSVPTHNISEPPPHSKHIRINSASTVERKVPRPQISPALYTTLAPTPLPDSPSSFPPSPYIINNKRRGPRLLKSSSNKNVPSYLGVYNEEKVKDNAETKSSSSTEDPLVVSSFPETIEEGHVNGGHGYAVGSSNREPKSPSGNRVSIEEVLGSSDSLNQLALDNGSGKLLTLNSGREIGEFDNFFDPQEALVYSSNTEGGDNDSLVRAAELATPMGEFFDASEELLSEGQQFSLRDIEAELSQIRLSMLMEIEKRKQAVGSISEMKSQWQSIRQQLAPVGLILPADLAVQVSQQQGSDPAEELCQQVYLARFVSESIGRSIAKAEAEKEMETQVEVKNFEIARLLDRLHYYEAVNHEMSQRNQEAAEMARRQRQGRMRKQIWIWGSVATLVTLGSAAGLVWSFLSSSPNLPLTAEPGDATK